MKPPAFQFYADDFIGGTVGMSAEEVGAYIRLLCYQWGNGAIPPQQAVVDRIAGCQVSQMVLSKFPEGKNSRLEMVRLKQQEFSDKQRRNINIRWNKSGNTTVSTKPVPKLYSPISDLHTPSPNNKSRCFAPPTLLEVEAYAAEIQLSKSKCPDFMDYYESNGWMVGKNKMKSWKATLRRWKNNSYGTNGIPSKPNVDRNAGTANEGKANQYAGVGRVVPLPNKG